MPVDRIQVRAGLLVALPAGQERDSGHFRRDRLLQAFHCAGGHRLDIRLLRAPVPGNHHAGLEHDAFKPHALTRQLIKRHFQRTDSHLVASADVVLAIHENLRFDDRHQVGLLAQGRIAGKPVGVGLQAGFARHTLSDGNHRPPLGETGTQFNVLGQTVAQAVQALRHLLARMTRQILGAFIHLDARHDADRVQVLRERRAVQQLLAQGLVEQDRTADMVAQARCRNQHIAVGAAIFLCKFNA